MYFKKKRMAAAAVLMLMGFQTTVGAEISIDKCEAVFSQNSVTVQGTANAADDGVLLTVYLKGAEKENFADSLAWQNYLKPDENGVYSDSFKMLGAGVYTITAATAEESVSMDFTYADTDSAKSAIEALNTAENIEQCIKDNKESLAVCVSGLPEPHCDIIASYVKHARPFNTSDIDASLKQLTRFSLLGYIRNSEITNVFDYADVLNIFNLENNSVFKEAFFTEELQRAATARISGKSINDYQDFCNKITEAMILAVVKNPNGFGNVKKVLEAHSKFIGISTAGASDNVYRGLCNADFKTCAELKQRFEELQPKQTQVQPPVTAGGGSGGGGGADGGLSMKVDRDGEVKPDDNINKVDGIDSIFRDLSDYAWAKESVLALYNRGIINGREQGVFAPADNVTRSEFVKMITMALDIKDVPSDMSFADVFADDWAYRYIKAAYGAGIVKGISDTEFGGDSCISRQDMAVMACRALEAAGKTVKPSDTDRFADDDMIADYSAEYVRTLKGMGVLNGDENGRFNPTDCVKRAEAAKVIYLITE